MKMKRYFAIDARQALRELREEQGPDAVILSNRKVEGGVEIIAALDYEDALDNASLGHPAMDDTSMAPFNIRPASSYAEAYDSLDDVADDRLDFSQNYQSYDFSKPAARPAKTVNRLSASRPHSVKAQSGNTKAGNDTELKKIQEEIQGLRNIMEAPMMQFAWGEMGQVQPLYASLLKQLTKLGLATPLSKKIADQLAANGLHKNSWLDALKLAARMVPIGDDDLISQGGIVALIGPTGVGKTTTIAKLAARYALRHGRRNLSLITMDSYRIGAHEQLRNYGRILGVPVQVATDCEELKAILNHSDHQHKLTLIDTAGMSQRDMRLSEQLATLNVGDINIKKYLVMSATSQINQQHEVIRAFGKVGLQGCILSKLDESASLGEALSVLIQHKLPMAYVCDGQKVPDDLHPARGKTLIREAVKLMKKSSTSPSEEELAFMFGRKVSNAGI